MASRVNENSTAAQGPITSPPQSNGQNGSAMRTRRTSLAVLAHQINREAEGSASYFDTLETAATNSASPASVSLAERIKQMNRDAEASTNYLKAMEAAAAADSEPPAFAGCRCVIL